VVKLDVILCRGFIQRPVTLEHSSSVSEEDSEPGNSHKPLVSSRRLEYSQEKRKNLSVVGRIGSTPTLNTGMVAPLGGRGSETIVYLFVVNYALGCAA
jgi:hypothetical protein